MKNKLIVCKRILNDLRRARESPIKVYGCTECGYMKSLDRKIRELEGCDV